MKNKDSAIKHFTASAIIIKDKKVLLVNHKKLGVWLYPGGHVEKNETPDQAVIRETKEETGLDIEIIGEIDDSLADLKADVSVLHGPYQILCELINSSEPHYHIDLIYICRIIGDDTLRLNVAEAEAIRFFSLKDLSSINLFPNFRKLLEKVLLDKI